MVYHLLTDFETSYNKAYCIESLGIWASTGIKSNSSIIVFPTLTSPPPLLKHYLGGKEYCVWQSYEAATTLQHQQESTTTTTNSKNISLQRKKLKNNERGLTPCKNWIKHWHDDGQEGGCLRLEQFASLFVRLLHMGDIRFRLEKEQRKQDMNTRKNTGTKTGHTT